MRRGDRGVALPVTFAVMMTLMLMGTSFVFMNSTRLKAAGSRVTGAQALWLAEAGLQDAFFRLRNNQSYRVNPVDLSGQLGEGEYAVTVVRAGLVYTVTSTGTVGSLARQVRQSVRANPVIWDINADWIEIVPVS